MAHAQHETSNVTNLQKVSGSAPRKLTPFDEFDQIFNMFTRDWLQPFGWSDVSRNRLPMFSEGKLPKVDIIDSDNELVIRAELPGVDKKDLEISMTDTSVTIDAKTSYEDKEEKSNYYRSEIVQGEYSRTINLPAEVNIDKAKSSFKNGVLELTVPKLERAKRRTIKLD